MSGAKEKKKIGLTTQIFIALIMGAILGIVLHVAASDVEFVQNVLINGVFYVIGQGFIRLMQMLVVPLVFCSLICGATAIGDSKTLGKVGIKIIGFYILTTMMAVAVALGIGLLIRPGIGLDMSQVQQVETGIEGGQSVSFAETILNIIPKNPIGALANGEMLQVIVFALIIGIPVLSPLLGPGAVVQSILGTLIGTLIANGNISVTLALPALFAISIVDACDFIPVAASLGEAEPDTARVAVPAMLFSRFVTAPIAVLVGVVAGIGLF